MPAARSAVPTEIRTRRSNLPRIERRDLRAKSCIEGGQFGLFVTPRHAELVNSQLLHVLCSHRDRVGSEFDHLYKIPPDLSWKGVQSRSKITDARGSSVIVSWLRAGYPNRVLSSCIFGSL